MKGALFDLDGIIVDTASYHFATWKQLIKKHFNVEISDSLEKRTKGISRSDSLTTILKYLNIEISAEKFISLTEEKNAAYVNSLNKITTQDILPGISQLLEDFKAHNIKTALASASKNAPMILNKLHLSDYFDAIVDPSNVASGKPAPDIFLTAAKSLSLQPENCVGIEDSVAGITAINKAGIVSIAAGGQELNHADYRFNSTAEFNYDTIEKAWTLYHCKNK